MAIITKSIVVVGAAVITLLGFGVLGYLWLSQYFYYSLARGNTRPRLTGFFPGVFNRTQQMRRDLGVRSLTKTDFRIVGGAKRVLPIAVALTSLVIVATIVGWITLLKWALSGT